MEINSDLIIPNEIHDDVLDVMEEVFIPKPC